MTVELAVCIPVILAVMGVLLNVMGYLNVCARFDRVAAEAVRIEATSPGVDAYGIGIREARVRQLIEDSLAQEGGGFKVDITVTAAPRSGSATPAASGGIDFSLLARLETFECRITYHPWPFDRFVGLRFFALTHQRNFSIDPYRPGVLL
jgi:hypothetical protein